MSHDQERTARQFSWPAVGNDNIIDYLDTSLKNHQLAQTYIFAGPDDLGKGTVALALAHNLLLSDRPDQTAPADFSHLNSDLYTLTREPGKKNISIEAVRDFIKMLSLSSFLNSYKVGIIKEADTLSVEAANALLKTLEEPRDKVVIILLAPGPETLLPTIVSRAQVMLFHPVPTTQVYDYLTDKYQLKRDQAREVAALSAGRPLLAARLAEQPAVYDRQLAAARLFLNFKGQSIPDRLASLDAFCGQTITVETANELLDSWQRVARDLMLQHFDCPEMISHLALLDDLRRLSAAPEALSDAYQASILIDTLKRYLAANVPPRTVLEQAIYNL